MQIQSVNSYNPRSNVDFGMDLRQVKGLEEAFPGKSIHELKQLQKRLEKGFDNNGLPGSAELDIVRVDDTFVEATISGIKSRPPLTCRFNNISESDLLSTAYSVKKYFFRNYNKSVPTYSVSNEWHVE